MWSAAGVCALALALTPASTTELPIRKVSVHDTFNQTVCPIEVVVDYDPQRLPARIRTLQCADRQLNECVTGKLTPIQCCDHFHGSHYFRCEELRETVVVRYKDRQEPATYEVAVGCACRIGILHEAADLPSGPTGRLGSEHELAELPSGPTRRLGVAHELADLPPGPTRRLGVAHELAELPSGPTRRLGVAHELADLPPGPTRRLGVAHELAELPSGPTRRLGVAHELADLPSGPTRRLGVAHELADLPSGPTRRLGVGPQASPA